MISNCNISAQPPAPKLPPQLSSTARPRSASVTTAPDTRADKPAPDASTESASTPPALGEPKSLSIQTLTAAQSAISDRAQAAAATHHARLLLQAQPRLALAAQANSSSQSVQRLLQ